MIELVLALGLCFAIASIARADEQSPGLWWFITFGICLLCVQLMNWPFMRIAVAGGLTLVVLVAWKILH